MIFVLGVNTATLRGQVELVTTMTEIPADSLFADAIHGRGIDQVDAGVQYSVQHLLGHIIGDHAYAPGPRASQPHASVAQLRDLPTQLPEFASFHPTPTFAAALYVCSQ